MKKFARILCAVLALVMISCCAFATTEEEYQARIAELEAQVADLEHQLAAKGYIAEFDGGFVTVEDAMKQYEYISYMYQQYGYSMEGYEDYIKQDLATSMANDAIIAYKAVELGLDTLSEEKEQELYDSASADFESYIDQYTYLFEEDGKDAETVREETAEYLETNGVTVDSLVEENRAYIVKDEVYAYCVKDVIVTDDDTLSQYEGLVATDMGNYSSNPGAYEQALMSGTAVYYHPEGYRNVKNLLVKFDDAQTARYKEITGRISDLEDELEEATAPEEESEEIEETEEAPRAVEDIQADLDAANAELDALYAELDPEVNDLITLLGNGTSIDDLIANRGGDPGSVNADGTINTYAVSANSQSYDMAFTNAAMSIENIGEISEPARGSYGVYILYYDSDVTPGEVGYENVKDDIYTMAYDAACEEAYNSALAAWSEELNLVYYLENFK